MFNFEEISRDKIPILRKFITDNPSRNCENTFGYIYYWSITEKNLMCEYKDFLIIANQENNKLSVFFPFGKGDYNALFAELEKYCDIRGLILNFGYISEENVKCLSDYFGDRIALTDNRIWSDYLYLYDDLANLSGKKYHTPKNHLNHFKATYPDYVYCEYNNDKRNDLEDFFLSYYSEQNKESSLFKDEKVVLHYLLENYVDSNFIGGLLYVNGKTVGFSIGEVLGDTLYVHFEKALREYEGSYAMTNFLFVKLCEKFQVTYINREEDVGDEGLRTAKMRLHPIKLIRKYESVVL